MRVIVGYIYGDSEGGVLYCLDDVPDPDVGEPVTLGELKSGQEHRCSVCGRVLKESSCE